MAYPKPANGLDQGRGALAGVDLLSQVADVGLDHAGVAAEVVAPHVIEDLCLGHDPAGVCEQVVQQVELRGGQVDPLATAAHLTRVLVELEIRETQDGLVWLRAAGAAQHGAYPGDQLLEAERLAHVVVGAQGEAVYAVLGRCRAR